MYWKSIFLLLLFFSTQNLSSQIKDIKFQQINTLNGVSVSSVYKIMQDRSDFIWLGTNEGLVKYDGYSYRIYKHEAFNPNSLSENWVLDIIEDKYGNLWLGTQGGGLCKFNPETGVFKTFLHQKNSPASSLKSNIVRSLYIDEHQILWVGSQSGLSWLDLKTEKILDLPLPIKEQQGLNKGSVNSICKSEGILYFGCWGDGLIALDPTTFHIDTYTSRTSDLAWLQENKIKTLKPDASGRLWIGTRGGGLNIFDPKTKIFSVINAGRDSSYSINSNSVQSILIDSRGNVWAGMFDNGLNMISPQKHSIQSFRRNAYDKHSLPSNWVASLFEDRSGLIWIGTDRGLAKVPVWGCNFKHISLSSSDAGEFNINAILQAKNGTFWFGAWGGGLIRFDPEKNEFKTYLRGDDPNSISNNNVWEIKEDKEGRIWIGTGDGLDCLDPISGVMTKYKRKFDDDNSLIHNNVSALLIDSKNRIWVGSWGEGLSVLDETRTRYLRFKNDESKNGSISDDFINAIFEDSKHRIWIATAKGGVNLYHDDGSFSVLKPNSTKFSINNNIESIAEDKKGRIWLGSNGGGLICYTPEKNEIRYFTQKNGLASDIVHRILLDDKGDLWISTNNGLAYLNLKTEQFKCFYEDDGLQANEFNRGAFKCGNGSLYFGGSNGVSFFDPSKITLNSHVPRVVLTSFKKYNTEYPINKLIKDSILILSYKDDVVSFEYAALDYLLPDKNHYQYKLEGLDTAWVDAGSRRFTTYVNLPPGDFVFRVKACNNNGVWNEEGLSLKIRILPPFWHTWWFYLICLCFALLIGFVYTKIRVRRFNHIQRRLEKMVNQKTAELLHQKNIVEEKNIEILNQKKEIEIQKLAVEEQRDFVTQQRDLIIEQNQELTDSIQYAKRIQTAMMNKEEDFLNISDDYFILFKPREIVSGDFYLFVQKGDLSYIAVADCTGHGIPGAFMSVLGISSLSEIINQRLETNSAKVLEKLRAKVIRALHQTGQIYEAKDGLDLAFCIIDHQTNKLSFAGANHSLYIIRNNELLITKGDPLPIGIYFKDLPFTNFTIDLKEGDSIYMLTDGYADQFGGDKGRKYMQKTFRELLLSNSYLPMSEQKKRLDQSFYDWKGDYAQIDDVLILGFRYKANLCK